MLILGCLVWFGVRYARWITTNFVVTTDRLIYRHGVLAKHGIEIPLERVNTVFFNQSVFERMLGAGDLVIESAGEMGARRSPTSSTRRPCRTRSTARWRPTRTASSTGVGMSAAAGGAVADQHDDSIPDQIGELDELRQQGLVSEDEFAAKKSSCSIACDGRARTPASSASSRRSPRRCSPGA